MAPERVHAELLSGGGTWTVAQLAEKLFQTPPTHLTAWAAWTIVQQGLYFTGNTETIVAHPAEKVAKDLEKMRAKTAQEKDHAEFVKRVRNKTIKPVDMDRMQDLEDLALNRAESSPTLKLLGIEQTSQEAHKLLIELGMWDNMTNPWPARFGVVLDPFPKAMEDEAIKLTDLAQKLPREDLTAIESFAIDDADIADPDDAFSVTRGPDNVLHVWVHVADVGGVVRPGSALDLAARKRAASCYLANGTLPMLPERVQSSMGLGLAKTSPALSIGFTLEEDGHIDDVKIVRSMVRVTRKTYAEAAQLLEKGGDVWDAILDATDRFRDRRMENGAVGFQMPQASVTVDSKGKVQVGVQEHFASRDVVMELMLMAGEAAAQFALDREIAFLYCTQVLLLTYPHLYHCKMNSNSTPPRTVMNSNSTLSLLY